jgi:hypothetical protein
VPFSWVVAITFTNVRITVDVLGLNVYRLLMASSFVLSDIQTIYSSQCTGTYVRTAFLGC